VRGILGQLNVGQNDKAADDDALGDRPIAEKLQIATRIIGAVSRYIDGMAFGLERRSGNLGGREVDGGTDRGAIVERSRGPGDQIAEVDRGINPVDDAPIDYELLLERTRPIDEADRDLLVGRWSKGRDGLRRTGHRQLSFAFADSPQGDGEAGTSDASGGRAFLLHTAKPKRTARTVAGTADTSRLLEEVASAANLAQALLKVIRNQGAPGVDNPGVAQRTSLAFNAAIEPCERMSALGKDVVQVGES
jgi:hypothetical protein